MFKSVCPFVSLYIHELVTRPFHRKVAHLFERPISDHYGIWLPKKLTDENEDRDVYKRPQTVGFLQI